MASNADPTLSERADVHKSCRALESLLGVFNDYCEAAGTIVLLQRKLAKALRETAGLKTTGEIAANAMNASAAIFETSVDINTRFAKFADKEYDALSAEVKKWFKKLAAKEKLHDERLSNANARIKQAGQLYEKKSKKNPHEAVEEHARYINLISTLGPEMSKEKHNHALLVTQRHTATTYSTAASLSRVADAEWLRTCECVRRFAPSISQLGEWRPLCEGGWQGPVPPNIPDVEEVHRPPHDQDHDISRSERQDHAYQTLNAVPNVENWGSRDPTRQRRLSAVYPAIGENDAFRDPHRPVPSRQQTTLLNGFSDVIPTHVAPAKEELEVPQKLMDESNTDSVRSLSAFPLPPTHFPIPPPRQQRPSQTSSAAANNSPTTPRFTDSPVSAGLTHSEGYPSQHDNSPSFPGALPPDGVIMKQATVTEKEHADVLGSENTLVNPIGKRPSPARSQTLPLEPLRPTATIDVKMPVPSKLISPPSAEAFNTHEFGIKDRDSPAQHSETVRSNGSLVAAMRDRFSNAPETVSPPPKDKVIPTSAPLSVTNLASRYESPPPDVVSPRMRPPSTSVARQQRHPTPVKPDPPRDPQEPSGILLSNNEPGSPSTAAASSRDDEAIRRNQQRANDLVQLELREKEFELLQRERELERRFRELAASQSRAANESQGEVRSLTVGSSRSPILSRSSQPSLRPRDRTMSFQASLSPQPEIRPGDIYPHSQRNTPNHDRVYTQHSYSTSHLAPPSPTIGSSQPHHLHDDPAYDGRFPIPAVGSLPGPDQRYKSSPTPPLKTRSPESRPHMEKSKSGGWMKRLSMPVGNALGLDSKKSSGHNPGVGSISGVGKSPVFSVDTKKNRF